MGSATLVLNATRASLSVLLRLRGTRLRHDLDAMNADFSPAYANVGFTFEAKQPLAVAFDQVFTNA